MIDILKIDTILEFYDEPQVFVARDSFDTLYLCLLYADDNECRYSAVRISQNRLRSFLDGKVDLRELFVNPEADREYFDVVFCNDEYQLSRLDDAVLPEDRLPDAGYFINKEIEVEHTIRIPAKDATLFKQVMSRFGWACL